MHKLIYLDHFRMLLPGCGLLGGCLSTHLNRKAPFCSLSSWWYCKWMFSRRSGDISEVHFWWLHVGRISPLSPSSSCCCKRGPAGPAGAGGAACWCCTAGVTGSSIPVCCRYENISLGFRMAAMSLAICKLIFLDFGCAYIRISGIVFEACKKCLTRISLFLCYISNVENAIV